MIFCPSCGNETREEAQFCSKCGKSLRNIPSHETKTVSPDMSQPKKSSKKLIIIIGVVLGACLLFLIFFIGILAAIAIPNFIQARIQALNNRVRAEHQSISTALESYYIDNNSYPLPDYDVKGKAILPHILTTPISYITGIWDDPFKNNKSESKKYEYGCDTTIGWIVTSYGPDEVDGNSGMPGGGPLDESKAWSDDILGFDLTASSLTYDPTNGTNSTGDIWRRGP